MSKQPHTVLELPRQADVQVEPRADHELHAAQRAPAPSIVRARRVRRLAGWLSALLADDGMSERFGAERRHDEGLIRRVEGGRRR